MNSQKSFTNRVKVAVILAAIAAATFSTADLKVVYSSTNMGLGGGARQTTIYYKGSMTRVETGPIVRIQDSKTHQRILINTKSKSYAIVGAAELAKGAAAMGEMMKVTLKPRIDATSEQKKVSGRVTKKYKGEIVSTMMSKKGAGGRIVTLHVETWATPSSGVSSGWTQVLGPLEDMLNMMGGQVGTAQLDRELGKVKGVPITTKLSGTMKTSSAGGAVQNRSFTIVTEAQSVSDVKLPDSLFKVPAGYKKVVPPKSGSK